ncbi:MAG: hypothetical protein AAF614_14080, partial [Chloroflexota bacterium]
MSWVRFGSLAGLFSLLLAAIVFQNSCLGHIYYLRSETIAADWLLSHANADSTIIASENIISRTNLTPIPLEGERNKAIL